MLFSISNVINSVNNPSVVGIVPVKKLEKAEIVIRWLDKSPSSVGNAPVKPFILIDKVDSAVKYPNVVGSLDPNLFSPMERDCNLERIPILREILPVKSFFLRFKCSSLVRRYKFSGRIKLKLFWPRLNKVSSERYMIVSGIVPSNLLEDKSSIFNCDNVHSSKGMVPDKELSAMIRLVNAGSKVNDDPGSSPESSRLVRLIPVIREDKSQVIPCQLHSWSSPSQSDDAMGAFHPCRDIYKRASPYRCCKTCRLVTDAFEIDVKEMAARGSMAEIGRASCRERVLVAV